LNGPGLDSRFQGKEGKPHKHGDRKKKSRAPESEIRAQGRKRGRGSKMDKPTLVIKQPGLWARKKEKESKGLRKYGDRKNGTRPGI